MNERAQFIQVTCSVKSTSLGQPPSTWRIDVCLVISLSVFASCSDQHISKSSPDVILAKAGARNLGNYCTSYAGTIKPAIASHAYRRIAQTVSITAHEREK